MSDAPRSRGTAIAIALFVAGTVGVALTQPRLAATTKTVKAREDVYVLPPPAQLKAMTLGYHAAAIDLLWAKLLVEYGTHWQEHRSFDDLPRYVDAILEVEPDYAPLFRYVDTMLVYRPPRGYEADARLARGYLEKGLAVRPYDAKVWMQYGQFIAFIAPGFLTDDAEKERWRVDGARAMMRAVELGANPDRAISAATILNKHGDHEASIRSLRTAYALTDDPREREEIARKLASLQAVAERDLAARDMQFVESQWRRDLPFLSRGEYLLVGPKVDPVRCAGAGAHAPVARDGAPNECAADWGPRIPSASLDAE